MFMSIQKKVAFYTLGCKLNFAETSSIGRQFVDAGYAMAPFNSKADVFVINTCSVTDHADRKCKKVVSEALRFSPNAYIVIVGCYAQLKPTEISEIKGVDLVLGAKEKFNLLAHIQDLTKNKKATVLASPIQDVNTFVNAYSFGDRTRSFLKVQDGCDYNCSFCTIPQARGISRSDSIDNVVRNAEQLAKQGAKEVVLTGVNIGDYGKGLQGMKKKAITFLDLIKQLDQINGINRFRISSIEPNLLSHEIIEFVAQSKLFMPHFHIPLQSGNNKILRLMRRRYLRELYEDRISTINQLLPHAGIGVDVIVGFPNETRDDFIETYNFINSLDISYLHVFTYSERDNTLASTMQNSVPIAERKRRNEMLRILSEKKRNHFYEKHLNTSRQVLWEAEQTEKSMYGFTDNYIRVRTDYDPLLVNELTEVELQAFDSNMDMCGMVHDNKIIHI